MVVNMLREWKLKCPRGKLDLVFPSGAGEIAHHANILHRGCDPALVRGRPRRQARQSEIRAARAASLLCVVVHQPEG